MVDYKSELLMLGKENANLVLLVASLPDRSVVSEFENFFPGRIFYFSNGERNMLATAAGFCLAGKLPLVLGLDLLEKGAEQISSMLVAPNFNVRILDFGGECAIVAENLGLKEVESFARFRESFGEYSAVYLRA